MRKSANYPTSEELVRQAKEQLAHTAPGDVAEELPANRSVQPDTDRSARAIQDSSGPSQTPVTAPPKADEAGFQWRDTGMESRPAAAEDSYPFAGRRQSRAASLGSVVAALTVAAVIGAAILGVIGDDQEDPAPTTVAPFLLEEPSPETAEAPPTEAPSESATASTDAVKPEPVDNETRALGYMNQALARCRAGQLEDSFNHATAAIALAPADVDTLAGSYAIRALAQHRLGKAEAAVDDATTAIGLAPPDRDTLALAYVTRALARNRLGQAAEAIDNATAAIDEAPTDQDTLALAYVSRALARSQVGQFEEAIDDATTAIARAPSTQNLFGVAAIRFTGTVYGPNPCNNEEVNGDTETLILYRAPNAGRLQSEDHPVVVTILATSPPDENLTGTYNNRYQFGLVAEHEFDTVQETYQFATQPPDYLEWIGLDGAPSYTATTSQQSVTISDGSWNHEFTTDAICSATG